MPRNSGDDWLQKYCEHGETVRATFGSVARYEQQRQIFLIPRTQRWLARVSADTGFALFLLLFAAVWLAHLFTTSLSPPTDNIEQLIWMQALEWGYYKHPPLPTWLFWLFAHVLGANAWTSYAIAAAVNLASMAILWRLLVHLRGHRYATLALFAVLCISYYNARLNSYNHNTVLLLVSSASAALCWKAFATRRLRWWIALGVVLGLGMLTKYQVAITMTSVGVFWLTQRGWQDAHMRRGLLLAALIALLMFVPHIQWLRTHDFGPIAYAIESSLGANFGLAERATDVLNWMADQLLNRALAAWLLLAVMVYLQRKEQLHAPLPELRVTSEIRGNAARALLLSWGLVPLVFMPLVGLASGSRLHLPWGTPFLLFAVPAAMELLGGGVRWADIPLRRAIAPFVTIQLLLLTLSYLTSSLGPENFRRHDWRSFDSGLLRKLIEPPLRDALAGEAVCVVSGPQAIAGVLALQLSEHPLVLIDGRYDRSPWINTESVKHCAVLQLQQNIVLPGGKLLSPMFPGLWWRLVRPKAPG